MLHITRADILDGQTLDIELSNGHLILFDTRRLPEVDHRYDGLKAMDLLPRPSTDGRSVYWRDGPRIELAQIMALLAEQDDKYEEENDETTIQKTRRGAHGAGGDGSTVTVTGTVTKASSQLFMDIADGVKVVWKATLSGETGIDSSSSLILLIGSGTFEVAAGSVSNSGGRAMAVSDKNAAVTVSGGTVSAKNGIAIYANGAKTITVSGGTVSADNGTAIYARGVNTTVTVSGGTVTAAGSGRIAIDAGDPTNTVIVDGTGAVSASGGGVAISCAGASVLVADAAEVTAPEGRAIMTKDANTAVTVSGGTVSASWGTAIDAMGAIRVSGGTVSADNGRAIYASGASSAVTVSGGTVSAPGSTGKAIFATGEGTAITISGGGVVFGKGSTVFSNGDYTISPIYLASGTPDISGTGVVLAWRRVEGNYAKDDTTDIIKSSDGMTAKWAVSGGVSGIAYANGANTGFVPVAGATVLLPATTDNLNITIPTGHTYTGSAQGIGSFTPASGVGSVTVCYEGTGGTDYTKSTTAPTNAGSYSVTADVADGTAYAGASNLNLGTYAIAKATLSITDAALTPKIYDGTTAAQVTSVTFSGGSPTAEDYTVSATFDNADAGTGKTATATVTLSAQGAQNYTLTSGDYSLSGQSIQQAVAITQTTGSTSVRSGDTTTDVSYALPTLPDGASWGTPTAGGSTPALISGILTVAGSTLTFDASSQADNTSATITVPFNGGTNYTSGSFTLTVTAKDKIPVAVTGVTAQNATYDGQFHPGYTGTAASGAYAGALVYTYAGRGGTTYADSANAPTNAGDYTVTVSVPDSDEDYTGSLPLDFSIAKRPVTVKADDKSMTKGGAVASFTYTVDGQLTGETALVGAPTVTSAANGQTAGSFDITVDMTGVTGYTANYEAAAPAFANGTLTVSTPVLSTGGGSSAAATTTPAVSGSTATTTVTPTVKNGAAAASVPASQVSAALAAAQKAAKTSGEKPHVEISLGTTSGATSAAATIPLSSMQSLVSGGAGGLTVSSGVADLTFDAAALGTISGAASGSVTISASQVDPSTLSAAAQTLVGNRPAFEFSVTSGGNTISQFGGTATLAVPYTLGAGENPNAVIVSYINSDGNLETVMNGHYDAATGTVTFTTAHFSQYAVGYNKVGFADVADPAWCADAVTFLSARGITSGTTATTFSPNATLTRGQFITLLLKAYGIEAIDNAADNFSDAGDTYYTGYLAAAKKLGITGGVGGNKFAPGQAISRQQMFTLVYNALNVLDQLPEGDSGKTLSDFTDGGSVAAYAQEAMACFVKTGAVSGKNGALLPETNTTRAQMAQVLYNLLNG